MTKTCRREAPFNAGEAEVVEARSGHRLEHNVLADDAAEHLLHSVQELLLVCCLHVPDLFPQLLVVHVLSHQL